MRNQLSLCQYKTDSVRTEEKKPDFTPADFSSLKRKMRVSVKEAMATSKDIQSLIRRSKYQTLILLFSLCIGLFIGSLARAAEQFGRDWGYPGIQPGNAGIVCKEDVIEARNHVIQIKWGVGKEGLRLLSVKDLQSGYTVRCRGELFRIVVGDGKSYAASDFELQGKPRLRTLAPKPNASRLAAAIPGRAIEAVLRSRDGFLHVRWQAILRHNANYVRQELAVIPTRDCRVNEIVWLDEPLPDVRVMGQVQGVPLAVGPFFLGIEDPHAINSIQRRGAPGENYSKSESVTWAVCRVVRNTPLRRNEALTSRFIWGVSPAGQLRRAFLYYLERERAHPYRPFLHYNSWYDIAWGPFALNETNCLEAIRLWGEHFITRRGVVLDSVVLDDGWDDPHTLWQPHAGFPHGFAPLARLAARYGTRLGLWLSPFGGYGQAKRQRLKFGIQQGYETNAIGFSLAGPKYYAAFKGACLRMMRAYGVNYFKFDGIAAGARAAGSGLYLADTEALQRLMLELREQDPDLYINFTTGSWPSPFWLRYADSLWRQGGDMGFAGKGPRQQRWLTYRDREVYRNIVLRSPLFPLNALMTQGVAYSRHGLAGDPSFHSAGLKDDIRAFFGSGVGLQELYIQPGKLTEKDWDVLAEAAKWSRANADVLRDTHWIGGDPGKLEVYGYASWCPRKGIVMLRNPDDRVREFRLDVSKAFELPPGAPKRYILKSPWAEDAGKPTLQAVAGRPFVLRLKPFEVLVLEALPVD